MASEHKNVNLSRCKTLHLVIRFISGVKQHIGQTRSHKNTACNVTKYVTILKASVEPCHNSTGNRYKDRDKLNVLRLLEQVVRFQKLVLEEKMTLVCSQ